MDIVINTNPPIPKLACLYDDEFMAQYEFVLLHGGRGGGKTEEMARKAIITTFQDPGHWLCTREIQNSINDSVYATIWAWIVNLGLTDYFHKTNTEIRNRITGARFIFRGMKAGTERDTIKSIKGIKFVWYEEAQAATRESLNKLTPTVRIQGRKFYFTYNPDSMDDAVNMLKDYGEKVLEIEINYPDNPYCPDVLIQEAELMKELYPELYKHVWLGQTKTSSDAYTVLPYDMLRRCIDAHKKLGLGMEGHSYGGLDLAPGEDKTNDANSLTFIKGCVVRYCEDWQCSDMDAIARRVKRKGGLYGIIRLFFDAVGVGGFANGTLKKHAPEFKLIPFMGSRKVMGGETIFMRQGSEVILNKDFFKNAGAQSWWNLRLRMENTIRMLDGKEVSRRDYFLSFDSENPQLEKLLIELSQATYYEDGSGRVGIDKTPGDKFVMVDGKKKKVRSPNLADSCRQAFLHSCKNGLRSN